MNLKKDYSDKVKELRERMLQINQSYPLDAIAIDNLRTDINQIAFVLNHVARV